MRPRPAQIPAVPLVRTDGGEPTVGDRYELRSILGSGGMGTVWEAYDRRLGRPVALKVLRDDLPPSAAARLEREARAAARINDPRVVTVLDLDRTRDGVPYLVLECHDGATLADELRSAGPLPPERLDRLVDDLLGALAAAHACGVLHRDVKPGNVLSSPGGFRVTDFGLASLDGDQTTETDLMGTLVYAAPERLDGARGSTRSDVFSAAVVLYEAATGIQPFRHGDAAASMSRLRRGDAPPLPGHLPLPFRAAVHRALSPDPDARPVDAAALLAAIRDPGPGAEPTIALDVTTRLPPRDPQGDSAGTGPPAEPRSEAPAEIAPAVTAGVDPLAEPGPEAAVEPTRAVPVGVVPAGEPEPAPSAARVEQDPWASAAPGSSVFAPEPTVVSPPSRPAGVDPGTGRSDLGDPTRGAGAGPNVRDRRSTRPGITRRALATGRRRPALAVLALGALFVLVLLLAEAVLPDGGGSDPAPNPIEQPTSLDGVLDRIEELGR